jgi:Fur family ferric uptake transcriptional regulator
VDAAKPFRKTKQREVILEELRRTEDHPTADAVYQRVRKRLPNISLGTVYRNLEILSECGMIRKLDIPGTQKRFDGKTKDHYHVRCSECGRIEDLPGGLIPEIVRHVRDMTDYEVSSHRLELIGLCPECRKQHDPTDGDNSQVGD